jgi:hypothetical protein
MGNREIRAGGVGKVSRWEVGLGLLDRVARKTSRTGWTFVKTIAIFFAWTFAVVSHTTSST